jgi:hypothetical protein
MMNTIDNIVLAMNINIAPSLVVDVVAFLGFFGAVFLPPAAGLGAGLGAGLAPDFGAGLAADFGAGLA